MAAISNASVKAAAATAGKRVMAGAWAMLRTRASTHKTIVPVGPDGWAHSNVKCARFISPAMTGDDRETTDRAGPVDALLAPRLVSIQVSTDVRPTEDGGRVGAALRDLFPGLRWTSTADGVTGRGTDDAGFRSAVKRAAIADAVAAHMGRPGPEPCDEPGGEGPAGDEGPWAAVLHLNKQAVMMGRLHLGGCGPALGDVEVRLEFRSRPDRAGLVSWFLDAPDVAPPQAEGGADTGPGTDDEEDRTPPAMWEE